MKKQKNQLQTQLSISIDSFLAQKLKVGTERENYTLSFLIGEILREGLNSWCLGVMEIFKTTRLLRLFVCPIVGLLSVLTSALNLIYCQNLEDFCFFRRAKWYNFTSFHKVKKGLFD